MERVFDPEIWRAVTGGAVAERVRRLTRVTPLVPAPALGRRTGADVWLKLENLQRTGSFKLRGAAARLAGGLGVEMVPRGIKILGASPEVNCAMRRSLDEGRALTVYEGSPTLAEGLEGAVSERTFAMARDYFPDIALVSEVAIRQAIVYAYRTLGILCEASA